MSRVVTPEDKATFVRDGAIVRRRFVPATLVDRARDMVNDWWQNRMQPARIDEYTQRTFAPEIGDHRDLLALYHESGVAELVAALVPSTQPVSTVQIQVRVPDGAAKVAQPVKPM